MPDRSSSLFFASVDSKAGPILFEVGSFLLYLFQGSLQGTEQRTNQPSLGEAEASVLFSRDVRSVLAYQATQAGAATAPAALKSLNQPLTRIGGQLPILSPLHLLSSWLCSAWLAAQPLWRHQKAHP